MTICPDCRQPVGTHAAYRDGMCPVVRMWARENARLDGTALLGNAIAIYCGTDAPTTTDTSALPLLRDKQ